MQRNHKRPLPTLMETWLSWGNTSGSLGPRRNSRGTPSYLVQLEKNQEILPSTWDEALFGSGISREIPPYLLSLERVLDTLDATQEVHQHTRLQLRGTLSFPPQLKKSPIFPSSSWHEGLLGASTGDRTHDKGQEDEALQAKAPQDLRNPLDLLEHLPQNLNLSVLPLFTNTSVTNGWLSPTTFLWRKLT